MSLLGITQLPTAENSAIHLHASDSVVIARVPLGEGVTLRIAGREIRTRSAIPAGHKLALRRIDPGETVFRYGHAIGRAKSPIAAGEHVHTHNLAFEELALSYDFPENEIAVAKRSDSTSSFQGYVRPDGRAGTRNYIAVVAASNCAAHTAELIAASFAHEPLPSSVDGIVAFQQSVRGMPVRCRNKRDSVLRQSRFLERAVYARVQSRIRRKRFRTALEYRRVPRFDAKRRDIDGHFRPRFIDDHKDAERHTHLREDEAVRFLFPFNDLAEPAFELCNARYFFYEKFNPFFSKGKALKKRGRNPFRFRVLHIQRIGRKYLLFITYQFS